jgi:hypothetical protein
MKDFSIEIYLCLLNELQKSGYHFQTFFDFLQQPEKRTIILRHDVDDRKQNALRFARIQYERGIKGTYYFRMVPKSFDQGIIRAIASMGHEVGYHYEDMDFARGDPAKAIDLFDQHLNRLRKVVPVASICMHGSPRSRYDNRDLWESYDYREYDIIGEPYFDIDFRKVFYLTDTGRRWDGSNFSIRDEVTNHFGLNFHNTMEIIQAIRQHKFPDKVLFTFHPQRWTDVQHIWLKEKYLQRLKNMIKYVLKKINSTKNHPSPPR